VEKGGGGRNAKTEDEMKREVKEIMSIFI